MLKQRIDKDILNIREASERSREEGMYMSEYTIRRVIKQGKIPCRVIGKTYLISWKNLVDWLYCVDSCDNMDN